jgi:predicted Zn-dependent protease
MLAALPAGSAQAFQLSGVRWTGATISYSDQSDATYRRAVRTALAAWNHSGARVTFVQAGPGAPADLIISVEPGMALRGMARPRDATTRAQWDAGTFASATISLVPVAPQRDDERGRELIVAHELGHVLGLAHENSRCAVMNATVDVSGRCSYSAQPRRHALHGLLTPDDIAGAVAIYGRRA